MTPLEKYFHDLNEIHSSHSAVDETPYYGSLEVLLNEVGKSLKPRVRCIVHPKNKGAGLPDGGLFTAEQFEKKSGERLKTGQLPTRGAMEVKPPSEDALEVALGPQVTRYLARYQQVLVTNLRQFVLVARDSVGQPTILEKYELAGTETDFWRMTARPRMYDAAHGLPFTEYLKRVMLHAAPLSAPEDVAFFLASYARDALFRVSSHDLLALANVRKALEEALGIQFSGEKGEHFFRSTLVQTLFYGVFSAWVLWSKQQKANAKADFDWKHTAHLLRVPVLRKLFHEVADPGQLLELNLAEILDWTTSVLNRVDRPSFFSKFQEAHAVQYFYEPFLQAFDPELRKELGVWFTPPEIVEYMVARVDAVLREELGLADGLADRNVYVLDPCCGTGSYLVEVLKKIHRTLSERGGDALLASELRQAAQKRIFGFELLPAPFVVAHLQLGLLLQNLGAPMPEKGSDRVGVYLTNALTGWELRDQPPLVWPEMEAERAGARKVKRESPILVVLGNPPYNGFAGVAVQEERDLTEAYRTTRLAPAPQGQGLNDLYVRFYRMAEHRIAEMTGKGVICFISNYSWLDGLSFTGMREDYLEKFDRIWVDCLNGDKFKTGKVTPDGKPDPSVFSTEWNHEGIQVGTAIGLLVRKQPTDGSRTIGFRHFWGKTKRTQLVESLNKAEPMYEEIEPPLELGLPFMPAQVGLGYSAWPSLPELLPVSFPGVKTSRDDLVIDIDQATLVKRMQSYFDPEFSHENMRRLTPDAMQNTKQFHAERTRDILRQRGFLAANVIRYVYRPFDLRWLYWEPETDLLDRKREDYFPQVFEANMWIEARQKQTMEQFDRGFFVRDMADNFGNGLSSFFPLYLIEPDQHEPLLKGQKKVEKHGNVSVYAKEYLRKRELTDEHLFFHIISVLNSPAYRTENSGALRQDWPRVVLPESSPALKKSAGLGKQLAELQDVELALKGITTGDLQPELQLLGVTKRVGGGSLTEEDLALTVGWGHAGQGGVTMPGKGKLIERKHSASELKAIVAGTKALGLSEEQAFECLGGKTLDVYLNDVAFWTNVPEKVWTYTVGGYQVIKKWLSYREEKLLGRPLSLEEARYVSEMVRRIAAILLLQPALDSNYVAVKVNARVADPVETGA